MSPDSALAIYSLSMITSAALIGFGVVLAGWLVRQAILRANRAAIETLSPAEPPKPSLRSSDSGGGSQGP